MKIQKISQTIPTMSQVIDETKAPNNKDTYSSQAIIDMLEALRSEMLLAAHPIGSYYWSEESTDPGTLFGGTWKRIKDKFIIAAGDSHIAGTSYGSNTKNFSHTHTSAAHTHSTGNHTLTTDEMPSHSHVVREYGTWYGSTPYTHKCVYQPGTENLVNTSQSTITISGLMYDKGIAATTGGSSAHNHGNTGSTTPGATGSALSSTFDVTPASVAAYCWKRIS